MVSYGWPWAALASLVSCIFSDLLAARSARILIAYLLSHSARLHGISAAPRWTLRKLNIASTIIWLFLLLLTFPTELFISSSDIRYFGTFGVKFIVFYTRCLFIPCAVTHIWLLLFIDGYVRGRYIQCISVSPLFSLLVANTIESKIASHYHSYSAQSAPFHSGGF